MLIPESRLIFWTASVACPLTLLAATAPETRPLALAGLGLLALVAVADAVVARTRLRGLSVVLPDVVRLQRDQPGEIEIALRNESLRELPLRVGLALPAEIDSGEGELHTLLPAGALSCRIRTVCTPRQRGRFQVRRCHLETRSLLGLWAMRAAVPAQSELRVYPDMLRERKNVAALFLTRGRSGIRAQRQSGKGRDFEKLREYVPGDGFDEIHWRASAKRGHPVTKVFQVERTQEVNVIIDASRLSARPVPVRDDSSAPRPPVLDRFMTAALILALAAEQQGDLYGLLTFSDRIERFVRARSGKTHYDACRDALYTLQPRLVTPDYEELAAFIRLRMRKRSLLIILTALDDPVLAESFVRSMDLVCKQHLILVNMLQPPGAAPVFSSTDVNNVDDLYECLGGHLVWHDLRELEKVLQRRGVAFRLLAEEKMAAELVSQYLNVKARQIL